MPRPASRPRRRSRACSCATNRAKSVSDAGRPGGAACRHARRRAPAAPTLIRNALFSVKPFLRHQLERYAQRLGELDFLLSREDIMSDMAQYRTISREHAEVTQIAGRFSRYKQREADLTAAREMLEDPDMAEMAQGEITSAEAELVQLEDELQRLLLPKDPDDARNAFLEIRAGTGGDESALFAGDLLRMYTRYCERAGWRCEVVSESESELGGYKEVVIRIAGNDVFGRLRFESGGHRVQRVPATETQGRIHTSACTVAVLAE